jgi:hypothetical protein
MKLTATDFEQLTINSTNWNNNRTDWQLQEGRFEDIEDSKIQVDYAHNRAYWVADYPSVLFVKLFLSEQNCSYRVYYDTAEDTYMITTGYGGVL